MAQARDQHPEQPRIHPAGKLQQQDATGSGPARAPGSSAGVPDQPQQQRGEPAPGREPGDQADELPQESERGVDSETEQRALQIQQRQRRQLLRDCERLLLLDFNTLAMPDWPDHHMVNEARRRRDLWLVLISVLGTVVLAGLVNLVPALPAGIAFGMLAVTAFWGLPAVRHVFTGTLSHAELVLKRRRLLHQARKHVEHLEGPLGLAGCCRHMADHNQTLRRNRFNGIYRLSEQGRLASSIRSRAQAQFYLIFLLEAEKAYNSLREAYFRTYEAMLDNGQVDALDAARPTANPEAPPLDD